MDGVCVSVDTWLGRTSERSVGKLEVLQSKEIQCHKTSMM
jgi:hypothetical protein